MSIVKVCILASSSAGNCTFVGTEQTRLLIDAGLSRRETFRRLEAIGEDPARLDAILITHEHGDHIAGLLHLARQLKIPIYTTHLTAPALPWNDFTPNLVTFQAGTSFTVGECQVESFTIPHDATDPVGFCFNLQGRRIGLVTDLGYIPDSVRVHVRGSDLLILESNHDLEMLKVGPYPWAVKQRVMGRKGHLSNDMVSEFILESMDQCTRTLVLAHLSEHNNHPALVYLVAGQALGRRSIRTALTVAEPRKLTEIFTL